MSPLLEIDVARRLTSEDALERLSDLFVRRGVPEYIRSDNGPEFTAKCVKAWLERVEVKTLIIEPGSPWENGYIESFNGKFRESNKAQETPGRFALSSSFNPRPHMAGKSQGSSRYSPIGSPARHLRVRCGR